MSFWNFTYTMLEKMWTIFTKFYNSPETLEDSSDESNESDVPNNEDVKYIYVKDLGKGSFGMVKEYENTKTGTHVAVKVTDVTRLSSGVKYKEDKILEALKGKHSSILEIFYSHIEGNIATLVTEVVPGEELYTRLSSISGKPLTIPKIKNAFRQLVEAIGVAHQYNIIHRDLKPENIIIYESNDTVSVKIIDWGLAMMETFSGSGGSPNYAAPEVVSKPIVAGPWNDVWSLGVILFTMLTRRLPFYSFDGFYDILFQKICDMQVNYKTPGLTPGSVKLLKKIFVLYTDRVTCQDLLKDNWLANDSDEERI
jgi:serine/threonine protein kinase